MPSPTPPPRPVRPPSTADSLIQTVALQAETIHLQAQLIAELQARLSAFDGDPDGDAGAGGTYLDGSPR